MNTDKLLGNLYEQFEEVSKENALKLTQILDLEDTLLKAHPYEMDDGSPCYCGANAWKPKDTDGNIVHSAPCTKARQLTEHLWRKSNEQTT